MCTSLFNCNKNEQDIFKHFRSILSENNQVQLLQLDASTGLDTYIGRNVYQKNLVIEEIELVVRLVRKEWFQLQNMVLCNSTIAYKSMQMSRELINKSFEVIIECIKMCEGGGLKERYIEDTFSQISILDTAIISLDKLELDIMVKLSTSSMDNVQCPVYQYFHTYLDIQYYMLMLGYICRRSKELLVKRLENLMRDLVTLSKCNYTRHKYGERSAFQCPCVRNVWVTIQYFSEVVDVDGFWKIFNKLLEAEEANFVLWLLQDVASLQTIDQEVIANVKCSRVNENFTLLESKLKEALVDADSNALINCFKLIEPLVCRLWLKAARIEVHQIIWDHYSKRLNVSNKSNTNISAMELNDLLVKITRCPRDIKEDFEFFVGMLLCHLSEYPVHWGKMKGRIFSQLGPNKVKDLSDIGFMHVMVLFMALANIKFEELSKKILNLMANISPEKKQNQLIWNAYIAFIIRNVKEGRSIENLAPLMVELLQEASNDHKTFRLVKKFILNFEHIINTSTDMHLRQWLLINNTWLSKYMATCYYPDLKTVLSVLMVTIDKVNAAEAWPSWEHTFKEFVYPCLKQATHSSTAPLEVGRLAGKISLLNPGLAMEAFVFFNSDTMPVNISSEFLGVVLENYPNNYVLTQQQEVIVVQSWSKICLLSAHAPDNLTNSVIKLDLIPAGLQAHLAKANDPFYALIEYLGSDLKQHVQSANVNKLCEIIFENADRSLGQYLQQPDKEALVLRAYTCIGLAFLHCGVLLYHRHKSTCPLTKLISKLLLPTEFLMGKSPHPFVLNSVKKTWQLYFEAIVNLNKFSDSFLERTQRDLVVKYLPFFSTADSPIVKCLDNEDLAAVIFEKISNAYFRHPTKETDANILKALRILNDFIHTTTSVGLLRLIVIKTLYGLFEVVIFHAQRNTAVSVINSITCSELYQQVNEDFKRAVVMVTEKYMAFNTTNYFQLMNLLAKFLPTDLKSWLPCIKQQVVNVERMRGVGFDKNLRLPLEKLENVLNTSQKS